MSTRSFRDAVASYFRARPGIWLDGNEIAKVGGCYAYRTRISNCRVMLGMRIENRVRPLPSGVRVSEYRYVPSDLFDAAGVR